MGKNGTAVRIITGHSTVDEDDERRERVLRDLCRGRSRWAGGKEGGVVGWTIAAVTLEITYLAAS